MTGASRNVTSPDRDLVPRVMLRAMAVLVLSVLGLVSYARLSDRPLISTPPASGAQVSRDILLSGDMSGAATVTTPDGVLIAQLSPEEGGFVSGVWRVISRERIKHRVAPNGPVTLIARENGRIAIHDPQTGWHADLMGFGADNARVFARLLAQQEGNQ